MYHGMVSEFITLAEAAELGFYAGPVPSGMKSGGAGMYIDRDALFAARDRLELRNKLALPDHDGASAAPGAPLSRPIPTTPLSPLPATVTKIEDRCPHCGLPRQRKSFLERACSGRCLPFNPAQPRFLP